MQGVEKGSIGYKWNKIWTSQSVLFQPALTYSNLTIETLEQGVKYIFIVNYEHFSHLVLVFLLLNLNM